VVAPDAPATTPAIAPVRLKLVGTPLCKAQISNANGMMANSGMQNTQATLCVPKQIHIVLAITPSSAWDSLNHHGFSSSRNSRLAKRAAPRLSEWARLEALQLNQPWQAPSG
jgi:hypothetical protein